MINNVNLAWLALTLSVTSQAATFEFDVHDSEPFYQTTLPKAVYQHSRDNNLNDLVVRNADGESIPYALVSYEQFYQQKKVIEQSQALTIFPLQTDPDTQTAVTQIQHNANTGNTEVNINAEKKQVNTTYLFDLGEQHPTFKKLALDWTGMQGKLLTVDILSSDNLTDWSYIGKTSLLKANALNQTIINNSVTFHHAIRDRYLQIKPKQVTADFSLTSAHISFDKVEQREIPRHWAAATLHKRSQNATNTQIDFESPGHYPVDQLVINLPQENTVTEASIQVRNQHDKRWRTLKHVALYRLSKDGHTYSNEPIAIPKTTAQYWRVSFFAANGGIGSKNPQLKLGWTPAILVWNARGASPYTLLVGDKNKAATTISVQQLLKTQHLQNLQVLPSAKLSLRSGEIDDSIWPATQNHQAYWLWGGLLLGVAALASMAYSLLKNNPSNSAQ